MYAAGYLEGLLTARRIEQLTNNTIDDQLHGHVFKQPGENKASKWTEAMAWLEANMAFVRTESQRTEGPFWRRLNLLISQFDGLLAGAQAGGANMNEGRLLFLNANGDLEDILRVINAVDKHKDKCSAMIKILPTGEVLFGHTTWDSYAMMVRSLKHYDFELRGEDRIQVSFSSSPGVLSSVDDFYLTDRGLGIMETTNGQYNPSLDALVTPASVLSWMRASVATQVARDAHEWARLFAIGNSGTYNNQWMAIEHRQSPPVLVVLEQSPGYVEWHNMTDQLRAAGYWASYNIPAFPRIYNRTGFAANASIKDKKPVGDYSHKTAPRAKMFHQKLAGVRSVPDFKAVLRYNNYLKDPLSRGDACIAIAERCDLNEKSPQFELSGAVDAKVTTGKMAAELRFSAQFGPTFDQQPVFRWDEVFDPTPLHLGQPEAFNFSWVVFGPEPWASNVPSAAGVQYPLSWLRMGQVSGAAIFLGMLVAVPAALSVAGRSLLRSFRRRRRALEKPLLT
jgi:hypothetical protein